MIFLDRSCLCHCLWATLDRYLCLAGQIQVNYANSKLTKWLMRAIYVDHSSFRVYNRPTNGPFGPYPIAKSDPVQSDVNVDGERFSQFKRNIRTRFDSVSCKNRYFVDQWFSTFFCSLDPLNQACQTGGPRAACGPFACLMRPAVIFYDSYFIKNLQ